MKDLMCKMEDGNYKPLMAVSDWHLAQILPLTVAEISECLVEGESRLAGEVRERIQLEPTIRAIMREGRGR